MSRKEQHRSFRRRRKVGSRKRRNRRLNKRNKK